MPNGSTPRVAGWRHVVLSVRDLDVSIEWYGAVLGAEVAFQEPAAVGRRAVVCQLPDGSLSLGLTQHGEDRDRFDPTTTGLDHAALRVDSEEELHRWAAHLDRLDVEHSGVIEIPPGGILNFKDPDGIALALFWARET
jgi:glyoxylase I family protein